MSDAYASLSEVNPAGTPLVLGAPGVYSKWVSSALSFAGPLDLVLPAIATDDITVEANGAGIYYVTFTMSYGADKVAAVIRATVHVNGAAENVITTLGTVSNVNDIESGAGIGFLSLAVGDTVDLRINSTINNTTIDIYYVSLVVHAMTRAL
jgi:hypothetical protein